MTDNEYRQLNRSTNSTAFFMINKKLFFLLGEKTTRYLAELIYKESYFFDNNMLDKDGYFYYQMNRMQKDTLLTEQQQSVCIKILSTLQIINVKKIGLPAKYCFKVNHENYTKIMASELKENIDNFIALCRDAIEKESSKNNKDQSKIKIAIINKFLEKIYALDPIKNKALDPIKNKALDPIKNKALDPIKNKAQNKNYIKNIKDQEKKVVSSKEETSKADALPSASNKTVLHKRSNGRLLMNAKLKVDKPLKAKKPIKPYQPTEQALDLIEFWEGKGLKSISHNPETKTYEQSLIAFDKLLSGKAFNNTEYKSYEGKKFTLAEIRKAISRFALMALNPDYEPRNVKFKSDLSKISPADFIFNAYVSSNGYGRSKFIYCHENEAKIIREKDVYVEDKYPNVTKAVMNKYKKEILGGSEITFTNDDLNAFRKAANFAYELFAKNQNRLLGTYAQLKPYQIAESMFEALERGGADFAKVKPHWLCNSAMQKQLPAYLYQAAILQDRTCEGQQQVHYYDFGRPFSG